MVWIGIAIGIIFTSCFGMALLVIVSKQKSEIMPKQLSEFWKKSLMNQRNQFHAIASIADAIEEHNGTKRKQKPWFLIEYTQKDDEAASWWTGLWFSSDANTAARYPLKDHAESERDRINLADHMDRSRLTVTEHLFMD